MDKHGVVPDVIATIPSHVTEITYSNSIKVQLGNKLTPTQVKSAPTVHWNAEEGAFYTLSMSDPDAPSRKNPKAREWQHWLVVNIPGNNVNQGEVMAEYVGSGPPKGSGLHRYVFVVYKQKGKIGCTEKKLTNKSSAGRANFSIKKFAEKYDLGEPVSGNFYQAEWDDYVPTLYKQLGN